MTSPQPGLGGLGPIAAPADLEDAPAAEEPGPLEHVLIAADRQVPTPESTDLTAAHRSPPNWNASGQGEVVPLNPSLQVISHKRYRCGLEIGCADGQLTRRLARRCDRVLAIDHSASALQRAIAHCLDYYNIEFRQLLIPEQFPPGRFDLILFSEPATYLTVTEFLATMDQILVHLSPRGHLVMVHRYNQPTTSLSVDEMHELLMGYADQLLRLRKSRHGEWFRFDLWKRGLAPELA